MKKTVVLALLLASFPMIVLGEETAGSVLLKDLIRIDTSNPPGNESQAARFVQELLSKDGITAEIIESAPGRGNLIARLKGDGTKPNLILLGHLDVVPADPKEWDFPPFDPQVRDGDLWGRGALDMKSLVAMEIETFLKLHREKVPLAGDVILVLVADEEAGGTMGAEFLVKNHWDKIEAKYVFNEGSVGVDKMGMHLFPIQVAEKGVAWFKLTARGTSGHGSMPGSDNAVAKLARAVDLLGTHRFPVEATPVLREFLTRVGEKQVWWKRFGIKLMFTPVIGPVLRRFAAGALSQEKAVRAVLSHTISPTMLNAGYKVNVIPAQAEASIDARILPGETPEGFLETIRSLLGEGFEIELIKGSVPSESNFDTEYFRIIENAVRKQDPEAVTAPMISAGGTDSRFFREKGAISYGLIPLLLTPEHIEGLHGKNERIPADWVEKGTEIVYDIVVQMQGAP